MADFDWSSVHVVGDPRLLVGRRQRPRELTAVRVDLHEDTFGVLAEIAGDAVDQLNATDGRPYEPFAALESGEEHFELRIDGVQTADGDESTLVHLLTIVDDLDTEDARELGNHPNVFYALCWPDAPTPVYAVKKIDPARVVRHARSFQQRDTLQRMENPDLILHDSIDFMIVGDYAGVLREAPFRQLFSDTQLALERVPSYVDSISQSLDSQAPLTDASRAVLTSRATARVSYAQRLGRLISRLEALAPTRQQIEQASLQHLGDAQALLTPAGELDFDETTVAVVLDLLEGRLFEDDFSGERRRADRWSRRL